MTEFKSKHARLSFYVKGQRKQFAQGRYVTDDKAEIEVLDGLVDAQRVEAPKKQAEEPKQTSKKPATKQRKQPAKKDAKDADSSEK